MSSGESDPISERNALLLSFAKDKKQDPNPKWHEYETISALWRIAVLPADDDQIIVACRTSNIGEIDSYSISVNQLEADSHIAIDGSTPFETTPVNAQSQVELGLTALNAADAEQLDELIDTLRLFSSIGLDS